MPGRGPDMWRQASCCGGGGQEMRIRVGDVIIGLVGLQDAMAMLYDENREPGPEAADELLAIITARNYVSRSAEERYKDALLREYTAYWAERKAG